MKRALKSYPQKRNNLIFPSLIRQNVSTVNYLIYALTNEINKKQISVKPVSEEEKMLIEHQLGFKFHHNTTNDIVLSKKSNDYKVSIHYSLANKLKTKSSRKYIISFRLLIHKAGQKDGFIVKGIINNKKYQFTNVDTKSNEMNQANKSNFVAPDFTQLEKELQKNFTDFISEFGINDILADFITRTVVRKDKQNEVNYLIKLKNSLVIAKH